jgi:hypothetical protein
VDHDGFAASGGDLVDGILRFFDVVAVIDDEVGAFEGEAFRDGFADA